MSDILSYSFMQNAVLASLLASVACGIIGSLVVVNRIVFISGGIAHTAYGGIGLAFFLGISPLFGAGVFAVVSALVIAYITKSSIQRADTVIGAMWAFGMAVGIILLDLTPGYNVDLMSYLFGSILSVPKTDLIYMAVLDCLIILYILFFYSRIHAVSFDREFASSMGVNSALIYTSMLVMSALAVVLLIRVVGLILIISMLTIPPYMAEKRCSSLKVMMAYATLFSLVFSLAGLYMSYTFNLTSGASIISVSAICFFLSVLYDRIKTGK